MVQEKTTQELKDLLKTVSGANLIPERLVTAVIERLEQLQIELNKYKAGNVPVTEIISDNESMAMELEELQTELRIYGGHLKHCPCYVPPGPWKNNSHHTKTDDELNIIEKNGVTQITVKCTCGFEQALKK